MRGMETPSKLGYHLQGAMILLGTLLIVREGFLLFLSTFTAYLTCKHADYSQTAEAAWSNGMQAVDLAGGKALLCTSMSKFLSATPVLLLLSTSLNAASTFAGQQKQGQQSRMSLWR